jgi:hypothetical protein
MTIACRLAAAALLLMTPSLPALADEAGEYTFTVLSNGEPVGRHRFVFERDGDRIEIQEATEIEVTFATIPLYTFEHQARQVWQDGRAVLIDATTDDNGEKLDITVRDTGHGYVRTVNGRVDRFDPSRFVLAYWNPDTLEHEAFFSAIEDKTLNASFVLVGMDQIKLAGKPIEAQHYRMVGDEERELWFDADGNVAKVTFQRYGTQIEYVRDQIHASAPRACTAVC